MKKFPKEEISTGKKDVPFSTVPENSDKRFYHENYIAKEMGTDRTHANRCSNKLRESGNFLSTNLPIHMRMDARRLLLTLSIN